MRRGWLVSGIAIGSLIASNARATDYWVDQSAAAGGDGSQGKPFQTIGAAINVLARGDALWIRNGTYQETPNFWNLPGTSGRTYVRADTGATPVIDGGGTADYVVQSGTPEMTFQGLIVRNGGVGFEFYQSQADGGQVIGCKTESTGTAVDFYYSSQGYVLQSDLTGSVAGKRTDGTIIESNRIHDSGAEGITLHDDSKNCQYLHNVVYDNTSVNIYLDSCSNMLVDGNLVYMTGVPPSQLAGIQMADEYYPDLTTPVLDNVTIVNNVIFNTDYGLVFWADQTGSAMKNVTIANNTIVNSQSAGFSWDQGPHQNTVIRNNVFASASPNTQLLLLAKSTSGVTLDHNLWSLPGVAEPFNWGGGTTYDHAGWVTASQQGAGDVVADPKFAGGYALPDTNLELASGSPAIDTGATVTLDHDYLGNVRPFGGGYDIGAFEFGAPPGSEYDGAFVEGGVGGPDGGADGGAGSGGGGGCGCGAAGARASGLGALGAWVALIAVCSTRRRSAPNIRAASERAPRPASSDTATRGARASGPRASDRFSPWRLGSA